MTATSRVPGTGSFTVFSAKRNLPRSVYCILEAPSLWCSLVNIASVLTTRLTPIRIKGRRGNASRIIAITVTSAKARLS